MSDFASLAVVIGLLLVSNSLTAIFGIAAGVASLGTILLLAGIASHLNGRRTAAATDPNDDAA